jgi:DNA-directed RNA polymerase specialized sigma24 family protein
MDSSNEGAIGRLLHAQFLDGDIGAYNAIYERYYQRIVTHIEFHAFRRESSTWAADLVSVAVTTTLSDYHDHPEKYNPNKSSLLTYLRNAAFRDYLNEREKEYRSEMRHRAHPVGNEQEDWKEPVDTGPSVDDQMEQKASEERVEALLQEFCSTDEELIIVRQIVDKERDAARCIVELGWPPGEESVRRLYKEKDKLMKRLRRSLPKLLGEDLP